MAPQTAPQVILIHLGYSEPDTYLSGSILNLPSAVSSRVDSVCTKLDAVDAALSAGVLDSMATRVDKLEVNYAQHLALLKSEGSRLIKELSALVMIPVTYDRFRNSSSTSTSVRSYW